MLILCCIIHCRTVDNTNLIWRYHYLCRFIVCGLSNRTSLIGISVYEAKYFCNTEIFGSMHGSILKFIVCLYMNHHSKLQQCNAFPLFTAFFAHGSLFCSTHQSGAHKDSTMLLVCITNYALLFIRFDEETTKNTGRMHFLFSLLNLDLKLSGCCNCLQTSNRFSMHSDAVGHDILYQGMFLVLLYGAKFLQCKSFIVFVISNHKIITRESSHENMLL